jgi:hypothetical protein
MSGNLPALTNSAYRNILLAGFFAGAVLGLYGEPRWFISNAAGMTLEPAYSRLALRGKYALMIDQVVPEEIPERLMEFYNTYYTTEIRVLYENGEESRRQWLFLDGNGRARLAAVFNGPQEAAGTAGEAEDTEEAGEPEEPEETDEAEEGTPDFSGFIEIYNAESRIVEEHQIDSDGADRIIRYFYTNQTLTRAETRIKKPASEDTEESIEPYCTDYYRYSRSASLRAVERVYHRTSEEGDNRVRLPFPHMVLAAAKETEFVRPILPISSDFFRDIIMEEGYKVIYTTDSRGRILAETRQNDDGEILGELRNTWTGNRLTRVHWISGEDDRLTEYEYDDNGDRTVERNINKGILERVVHITGDREIEELYMDNRVVLRAIWEKGLKISEERIRRPNAPGSTGGGGGRPQGSGRTLGRDRTQGPGRSRSGETAGTNDTAAAVPPEEEGR